MNSTSRRLSALLGAAAIAGTALLVPATAHASPALSEDASATNCQVASADLGWGLKQSFRQYITGAIANGSWETGEGVEYLSPVLSSTGAVEAGSDLFSWSTGVGEISSDLSSGAITFTGNLHFEGHDGGLELNIANPGIEFSGEDSGYLLLEVGEAAAGEAGTQVRAAKLDLAGAVSAEGETLEIANASVRLTAEGAEALNGGRGSYVAGEEMDPLFVTAMVSGCELGTVVAAEDAPEVIVEGEVEATPISAPVEEVSVPWVPIIIGGVALIVIGVAAGMLIAGRNKGGSKASAPVDQPSADGPDSKA